jgi:catalase-peroxidase
MFPL